MSTPLINDDTFANARTTLEAAAFGNSMLTSEVLRAIGLFYGAEFDTIEARIAALVFDWQRSNRGAHCVRYAHIYAEAWKGEEQPGMPEPAKAGKRLALVALYKALQCIHYNCDAGEGSGDTLKASLTVLDALIDTIGQAIITEMPEYKAANWPI